MGEYNMGDAIKKFLKSSRINGDIQALQIGDVWENIMGKTVARYTEKLRIVNKTLYITTTVAPLKQELLYQKETIKKRVNDALGAGTIQDIIIQ
jgi:hypothetical protein